MDETLATILRPKVDGAERLGCTPSKVMWKLSLAGYLEIHLYQLDLLAHTQGQPHSRRPHSRRDNSNPRNNTTPNFSLCEITSRRQLLIWGKLQCTKYPFELALVGICISVEYVYKKGDLSGT